MSNPEGLINSMDPVDGAFVFPTDVEQPETQGDEPLEAELGEDGQGDLAAEDEGGPHSGDAPTDLRTSE
ncbi:hypothetical protein GCM10010458_24560 [Microbacterium luteolum]|uniref:Uncharacterized protein n=2 Tax=Microbacterium TaxID=33882 RepID=A0AAU7VU83_9MICO|nr:hypothetical protein [Microbacterium luteolum]WDM45091.1 hypothetical protein KV395_18365 [Microbacterium luteolum]